MIIVLDGADGTGKTTLANKLVETFTGAKYIHATWSRELDCRMLEYHMGILADAYKFTQETRLPAIIDRLWLSEAIYSQVFRNGSKYPKEAIVMDTFIELIGGINVITLADDLVAHSKRFEELKEQRIEMYKSVSRIAEFYNQVWNPDKEGNDEYYCLNTGYLANIMAGGGLHKRSNYFRYSIEDEGRCIDEYLSFIKYKFEQLNPYWGRK